MGDKWNQLALVFAIMGGVMDLLCMVTIKYATNNDDKEAVESMFIIAFLIYCGTLVILLLTHTGGIDCCKFIFKIIIIAGFIFASIFIIAGLGVYGDNNKDDMPPFWTTVQVTSMFFALAAALFVLLGMLCGGSSDKIQNA